MSKDNGIKKETAAPVSFSEDKDFEFVQLDKNIHDVKLSGKPTTFMKDAMKRFVKNKGSVVAACILTVLIGMAIIVPFANSSDIDKVADYAKYLPPKWFEPNGSGFLDGTKSVTDIIAYNSKGGDVTKETPVEDLMPIDYSPDAIVGEITKTPTLYSAASKYGYGGSIFLAPGSHSENALFYSAAGKLDVTKDYELKMVLNEDRIERSEVKAPFRVLALVDYSKDGNSTSVVLQDWTEEYTPVDITAISEKVDSARPDGIVGNEFSTAFEIELETNADFDLDHATVYPELYIDSIVISSDTSSVFDNIGFSDANECALRWQATEETNPAWKSGNNASRSVVDVNTYLCSFRFDCYQNAFGIKALPMAYDDFKKNYIDPGYCEYDLSQGISSFKILNDEKCAVREITEQKEKTVTIYDDEGKKQTITTYEMETKTSYYRYYGFTSIPKYIFGTNNLGQDYFKYLFKGLGTSLLLGVLCALINISIGLIWGAISGYFGGWTDMLMERFTEILGGIPFLVVMTLCLLLFGQTFEVFLLSLCLTGWMGVASMTRSQFYRYKGREYVLASRTLGAKDWRLIFKHILPNAVGPIVTGSVLIIPGVIFDEASISFLKLGLKGMKSFGVALSDAQGQMNDAPYLIICGSIIICLLMISFNLFGNGLRDAFNPSLKGSEE